MFDTKTVRAPLPTKICKVVINIEVLFQMRFSYIGRVIIATLAILYTSLAMSHFIGIGKCFKLISDENGWSFAPNPSRCLQAHIDLTSDLESDSGSETEMTLLYQNSFNLNNAIQDQAMTIEPAPHNSNRLFIRSPNFQPGRVITVTLRNTEEESGQMEYNLTALNAWLNDSSENSLPQQSMLNIFTPAFRLALLRMAARAVDPTEQTEETLNTSQTHVVNTLEIDTPAQSSSSTTMTMRIHADGDQRIISLEDDPSSPSEEFSSSSSVTLELTTDTALKLQHNRENWVRYYKVKDLFGQLWDGVASRIPTRDSIRKWSFRRSPGSKDSKQESTETSDMCLATTGHTCGENEYSAVQWQALSLILTLGYGVGSVAANPATPQLLYNRMYSL